jgi:hypothetical protein
LAVPVANDPKVFDVIAGSTDGVIMSSFLDFYFVGIDHFVVALC